MGTDLSQGTRSTVRNRTTQTENTTSGYAAAYVRIGSSRNPSDAQSKEGQGPTPNTERALRIINTIPPSS